MARMAKPGIGVERVKPQLQVVESGTTLLCPSVE